MTVREAAWAAGSIAPRMAVGGTECLLQFVETLYPRVLDDSGNIDKLRMVELEMDRVIRNNEDLLLSQHTVLVDASAKAARRATNAALRNEFVYGLSGRLTDLMWVRRFGFTRAGFERVERLLSIELLPSPQATSSALRPRETLLMVLMACRNGERARASETRATHLCRPFSVIATRSRNE